VIQDESLHSLADNELTESEKAIVLKAIERDSELTARYQSILAVKAGLRSQAMAPECQELWRDCRARLDEIDNARKVERFVGKYSWGICGVFFLAILVGGIITRSSVKQVGTNDVAGVVASMSPISVPQSRSQAELDPLLRQVIGETFKNRPTRMAVTAIGSNPVPGERAEFVQLSDEFGAVALVAFYDIREVVGLWDSDFDPAFKCGTFDGVNALFWQRPDGVICMAAGQRSYAELYRIVQAMSSRSLAK
jgi:hypothetical protein